jgi:hypothetical protein
MEEEGSRACLCPDVKIRFEMCVDDSKPKYTYEQECSEHDRWNACDVNGDVDLYIT